MGAHHGQNNYIPDFAADSALRGARSGAGEGDAAQGQRPRPLHRRRGRHAVEHRRTLSPEPLAMARNLEDEPGADQEPEPHLSRGRDRARPHGAGSAPARGQAGDRETPARGPGRAPGSQAGADHTRRPSSSRSCPSRSSWAPTELDSAPRITRDPGKPCRDRRRRDRLCVGPDPGQGQELADLPARRPRSSIRRPRKRWATRRSTWAKRGW